MTEPTTISALTLRPLRDDLAEVNVAASFSMLTILETLPEARRDPTIVPNLSIDAMAAMYRQGLANPAHRYRVVEADDGRLCGHAIALLREDEGGARYGYCYTRYVLPAWRRRGLGRRLLADALGWFGEAGAGYALAHTHVSNVGLQALFIGAGFEVVARGGGRWPSLTLRRAL